MFKTLAKYLHKLEVWYNNKTGRLHWYNVRFIYKDKMSKEIFNWTDQIGLADKDTSLNHREMKRIVPTVYSKFVNISGRPEFTRLIKSKLCNGYLGIEIICYLGKIKK